MKTAIIKLLAARIVLVAMICLLVLGPSALMVSAQDKTPSLDLRNGMRKLWEDHITWTRLYIVSFAAGLPDTDATAQRLLKNQEDIGNAMRAYYGDAAADKLTALLKDHILGAVDILAAAKAGDNAKVDAAKTKWYANGNDIAAFLNGANPTAWPLDTMKAMMKEHLDLTLAEATARLQKDYAADIAGYEKVHTHILGLSDGLSAGIIAQFPDKFSPPPSPAEVSLRLAMRKLWEDHITWTRLYIVSFAAGLPDMDPTAQRLLKNQEDIGNAMRAYYGDAAADKLIALLKVHIQGAVDLLTAAKAGDSAKVDAAKTAWYANADDIATFLNGANPTAWPLDTMKASMKMHLDVTLEEATARLQKNYAGDIAAYEKVHTHILGLADALSAGILAQFPAKFPPATLPTTGGAVAVPPSLVVAIIAGVTLVLTGSLMRRHKGKPQD